MIYIAKEKQDSLGGWEVADASTSIKRLMARLRSRDWLHLGIQELDLEYAKPDAEPGYWFQVGEDGTLMIEQFTDDQDENPGL